MRWGRSQTSTKALEAPRAHRGGLPLHPQKHRRACERGPTRLQRRGGRCRAGSDSVPLAPYAHQLAHFGQADGPGHQQWRGFLAPLPADQLSEGTPWTASDGAPAGGGDRAHPRLSAPCKEAPSLRAGGPSELRGGRCPPARRGEGSPRWTGAGGRGHGGEWIRGPMSRGARKIAPKFSEETPPYALGSPQRREECRGRDVGARRVPSRSCGASRRCRLRSPPVPPILSFRLFM